MSNKKNRAFDKSKWPNWIDPNEVIPYDKNAKLHDERQVRNVANSIRRFGWQQDTVITRDKVLVIGHCRRLAALQLGCMLPYHVIDKDADELTDEDIKELRLADNLTNESPWDYDLGALDMEGLSFDGFEFDLSEFVADEDEPAEIVEDEVPEEVETRCKLGDLWQLGNHRLVCGNSTDVAVIDRLMDGVKADMVFTDPPYGMLKANQGVLNDNLDSIHQRNKKNLLEFNKQWIPLTLSSLKSNGSWYCWGKDEPLMDIYCFILKPYIEKVILSFRNLITWDKGSGEGQKSDLFRKYPVVSEKCLFCQMGFQEGVGNNGDDFDMRFEPIRKYIEDECEKCGINEASAFNKILSATNKYQHLVTKSHWYLAKKEDYLQLKNYAETHGIKAFEKPYNELQTEYNNLWAYFDNTHDNMNDVWHFDRTSQEERKHTGGHATPKPIALCSRAIKSSSREGEIVLDVFGGSGSTLIACEQLNRKCYMAELSPEYCDVILQRWENFTGEKAVLLNGE